MPKKISNALTPLQVKNAQPGRHVDGNGLHLLVKASGAGSWVLRYTLRGRARDLGLSRCPEALALLEQTGREELSLAQARDIAAIYRLKVRAGIDPLAERQQAAAALVAPKAPQAPKTTFADAAQGYLASRENTWRNAKHRQQWHNTLETYAMPVIGNMPIQNVGTTEVLRILEPIWPVKPETASRLRGRIEAIIDAARVRGNFAGENPARWRGHLDKILPARQRLSRGHHTALSYAHVPVFLEQLRRRKATAAMALEFLILTAARTGEVLGATWQVAPLLALLRSKTLQLYSLERLFLRSLLKRNGTQRRKVPFDGAMIRLPDGSRSMLSIRIQRSKRYALRSQKIA